MELASSDTIKDVKDKIQVKEGIPSDKQRLIYHSKELEDSFTLIQCNVQNRSTLRLNPFSQIFVKTLNGKTIALDVEPSDTVRKVKEKIRQVEEFPDGKMPALKFGDTLLDDGVTLAAYNIPTESTLHIVDSGGR